MIPSSKRNLPLPRDWDHPWKSVLPLSSKRNIALNVGEFARHEWIQIPIAFSTKEKKISFKHELSERRFLRKRKRGRWMFFSFLQKSKVFDESLGGRIYTFQTPRVQIIVGRSSGTYLPLVRRDFIRGSGRDLLIWGQIPLEDEMRGAAEVVVLQEGWHVWWLFATQLSPPTDSNSKTPPVYGVYFLVDTAAFDPIHFTFFFPNRIYAATLFSNFYILNNYNLPCNLSSSSSFTCSVERYV